MVQPLKQRDHLNSKALIYEKLRHLKEVKKRIAVTFFGNCSVLHFVNFVCFLEDIYFVMNGL